MNGHPQCRCGRWICGTRLGVETCAPVGYAYCRYSDERGIFLRILCAIRIVFRLAAVFPCSTFAYTAGCTLRTTFRCGIVDVCFRACMCFLCVLFVDYAGSAITFCILYILRSRWWCMCARLCVCSHVTKGGMCWDDRPNGGGISTHFFCGSLYMSKCRVLFLPSQALSTS